jgi:hypothetical protein
LVIILTDFALLNTIAINILLLVTPKKLGGVVLGVVQLFIFTRMTLGLVISGLYLQNYQTSIDNGSTEVSLPSYEAYQLIFLTTPIASFI